MQNTWAKLDEPSMYKHGLGTLETERSNVSHIVDMVNIEMFIIDDYPIWVHQVGDIFQCIYNL